MALSSESSPRAVHESQWSAAASKKPSDPVEQRVLVVVSNAPGSIDGSGLVRLLERETKWNFLDALLGREEDVARFFCDGCVYEMSVVSAEILKSFGTQHIRDKHHVNLVFTYDSSSRQSWDEMAASYEEIRGRCEKVGVQFTTMMLAMGEGQEGKTFASQRACLSAAYSPITGHGICSAFASLVEHTHGAQTRDGNVAPIDSPAKVAHTLFSAAPGDE